MDDTDLWDEVDVGPEVVVVRSAVVTTIGPFVDEYRFLSNFALIPAWYDGVEYRSGEHAYQAGKTVVPEERMQFLSVDTPMQAKRLGQRVTIRPGWDEGVAWSVMSEVVSTKFGGSAGARQKLLSTGSAVLREVNHHHDVRWGVCICSRHNGQGTNWLGLLTMGVRDGLREA